MSHWICILYLTLIYIYYQSLVESSANEFERHGLPPTHWLLWVSRRVIVIFIFIIYIYIYIYIYFCKLFFGDHRWLRWAVGALFHIYHMTSFNYDAKDAVDVGLSCRCHLCNSQIVSSVWNMLERVTCLWLCVSVLFAVVVVVMLFKKIFISVFLLVCCLCFVFFFWIFHRIHT